MTPPVGVASRIFIRSGRQDQSGAISGLPNSAKWVSFKYVTPGTAAYQIELLASSVFELALKSERKVALSRDFYLTSLRDQGGRKATSGHVPASRSPTLRVRCSRDTYRINACSGRPSIQACVLVTCSSEPSAFKPMNRRPTRIFTRFRCANATSCP